MGVERSAVCRLTENDFVSGLNPVTAATFYLTLPLMVQGFQHSFTVNETADGLLVNSDLTLSIDTGFPCPFGGQNRGGDRLPSQTVSADGVPYTLKLGFSNDDGKTILNDFLVAEANRGQAPLGLGLSAPGSAPCCARHGAGRGLTAPQSFPGGCAG